MVQNPLMFWKGKPDQFKRNPLTRCLSAEIECDQIDISADGKKFAKIIKKWSDSIVHDGSLHGDYAHEVNTAPSNGDLFMDHIGELTYAYKGLNAGCTTSCGLHIHVDCSDLKFYDLRKVILLYAKVEHALFDLCAPRRLNANYSRVCGNHYSNMSIEPDAFKRQLLGKFYNGGSALNMRPTKERGLAIKKNKSHKYNDIRYRALNLHSFFLRKSIEFRHHEGSVDFETITNWARVCGWVIEFANIHSEAEIRELSNVSRTALLDILPEDLAAWAKKVFRARGAADTASWESIQPRADLPAVPKEEIKMDRKAFRKKLRAEKRARAKIDEIRLKALYAIINEVPLDAVVNAGSRPTPPSAG